MTDNVVWQMLVELEGSSDSDQEELDALTLDLRESLLELEVERIDLGRHGNSPKGAKSGVALTVGTLVVTIGPLVLRKVLDVLDTWIQHRPVRTISVTLGDNTLEIQAASAVEQRRVIDAFIAAHESAQAAIGRHEDN